MSDQTEKVEHYLIQALLNGTYPPGTTLPGERELADRLGVTRQNVQGVIQRMAREGWFTTGQRYATRINDFWSRGNLAVLNALAENIDDNGFVGDLLAVRRVLAPAYALQAVDRYPLQVVRYLAQDLTEADAAGLAGFDFELHLTLARLSENRVYPLLLNSFTVLSRKAGLLYFSHPGCREASLRFYQRLLEAAVRGDARAAYRHTVAAMKESCRLWREMDSTGGA
ncbi:MAG TPA: GntR family transcriptional regulator [Spirochaetia bacterium]|nr:GntR family transcriptional regulator [Spirochaetia bacterium]